MNTHLLPDVRLAHLELAAALQQNSLAAAARHTRSAATQATPAGGFADRHMGSSRVFAGTHDQVSAVRRFARAELGDHPAIDEAVLVASELATNRCCPETELRRSSPWARPDGQCAPSPISSATASQPSAAT